MDKYVGKRLDGRYEIKEIIGVGGMAYVYKAFDNIDNRTVAIKILKEEYLQNEEFTRRFKNESKAIAILSHPNIVKVYDVSFGDRMQYIVMEYIDGITLKEYIDGQAEFKWKEAVHFTVQILRALQHAHDKGIVHRDIKPQNIMLLPDGTIKVADFGIARFSRQDMNATRATDKAIGSVHYISPEQARGEFTDEKADIYSVGVMLYEMLTGKLPFEADSAVSVAIMQMQSEATPPRQVNANIPEGLEDITVKAMQKDTSKRYQSAAEMLYDIDEFKKNPSIHFEYKYFVDDSPTRYMDTISKVRGEEPVRSHTRGAAAEPKQEEEQRKPFPIIPVLSAVAAAFVIVCGIVLWLVFKDRFTNESKNYEVPQFVGMTVEEITNHKDYDNWTDFLNITLEYEYNDTVAEGLVIKQSQEAGLDVKQTDDKKDIVLTISKGPKPVRVPSVVGMKIETATRLLEQAGLVVQLDPMMSEDVEENYVIAINPPDAELPTGTVVLVTYSTGNKQMVKVPWVETLTEADAVRQLEAAKLKVEIKPYYFENSDEVDKTLPGTVMTQSVPNGTNVPQDTVVVLEVYQGYCSTTVTVQLPTERDVAVDFQVYVKKQGGATTLYTDEEINALIHNIGAEKAAVTLHIKYAAEEYTVLIKVAPSGTAAFRDYVTFTCDGKLGGEGGITDGPHTDILQWVTPPVTDEPAVGDGTGADEGTV